MVRRRDPPREVVAQHSRGPYGSEGVGTGVRRGSDPWAASGGATADAATTLGEVLRSGVPPPAPEDPNQLPGALEPLGALPGTRLHGRRGAARRRRSLPGST